jgi:hypothetical protein
MNDLKTLFLIVLAFGALAAIWWFGWFGPVAEYFRQVKELTTYE